ncbi:MAG: hypothetical protein B7Z75_10670 [Acidocella sp. 20-57-95]|nr:MAG: hypothetical protein B7Z75_10670 [Acidocella sp. 20-57-95]OYV58034.1 MAG: hypothetical protein B7Z71_11295 [Acidocella sp. 21-58-7]HQT65472.1 DUF1656 domain-containing protein [Acidocella sp.]HQU05347.1 DUF1656 domain-containing protein [Acidocella sp.]
MIGEIDLYGVLCPPLLIWLAIALLLSAALRYVLNRSGFYRYVWHRPLFDLALLVMLLAGVSALANHIF